MVGFLLDTAKTFTLEVEGTRVPAKHEWINVSIPVSQVYPHTVVFDVPESFRSGTVRITPEGQLFIYRREPYIDDYYVSDPPTCGGDVLCLRWRDRPRGEAFQVELA